MSQGKNKESKTPAPPPSQELIVRPIPQASLEPSQGTPLLQCPTNLDLSSPWGKALAVASLSPSDMEFDERGCCEVTVTAYIMYPHTVVNRETGEEQPCTRTVFFDAKGRTFATTSQTAPHKLGALLSLYTTDEWRRGIPLVVQERRSRKTGRTYHDIRVLPTPPVTPDSGGQ